MSWTDERVEMLKAMWTEGKSASQIAKELGGVTRNAVIGKVHRLGLSNRVGGEEPANLAPDNPSSTVMASDPVDTAGSPAPQSRTDARTQHVEPMMPTQNTSAAVEVTAAAEAASRPQAASPQPPATRPRVANGQPLPPQPAGAEMSEETLAHLAEAAKKAKRLSLMQLTERTCKWPVGDPATDDFWFCGLPSTPGKPYCETHVNVAFQPMSSRRDRRPSGGR
jgi:GcrA cell cycle regulator